MTQELSNERKNLLKLWMFGISIAFILLSVLSVLIVQGEKDVSSRNHALRMSPTEVEPGKTPPDAMPTNTNFTEVNIGVYLEGIENLSVRDSNWTPTFYLWFRWKGDKSLDPGKNFRLVDAKVDRKELVDAYTGDDGVNYQIYKIISRNSKFFNTTRVPLDDHMLNIYVEDSVNDVSKLRYVVDPATQVSSRVKIPGYNITGFSTVVKPHTYKTTYGDPRVADNTRTTFSEFNFALTIKRSGIAIYLKLFIGLFAGVVLTMCSFFIRPSDTGPRYALPSAAYFGVIANAYMTNSLLPPSSYFGLTDLVTGIGLFTISLCVVASLVSGHYYLRKKEEEFSRQIDQLSWRFIGAGFLVVNIILPVCAFY